ncbi:MAG: DUF1349 domain-containing protein [Fimbriiglobus sp.]|jgi:hypothetical protein|nr:DUF1349 domain-containing protein [Fimbriiglobus sp.]
MFRTFFTLILLPLLAVAAPVPKPPPKKMEEVFGTFVEANGVTAEMTRRGELKVEVSKDAAADTNRVSTARPLVTRTVEGDFELVVRVTHSPPTAADLTTAIGAGNPTVTAGLALYAAGDPKSTHTFLQKHARISDAWRTQLSANTQHQRGGSGTGRQGQKLEEKPIYLRLTRKGDEFKSETSTDGKKWQAFATHKATGFGGAVVVGPVATHNITGGYEVTFDEYEIKPVPGK